MKLSDDLCTHVLLGKYPAQAVAIMSKICLEAEAVMFHSNVSAELRSLVPKPTPTVQTIAIASVDAAFQQNAGAIITLTTTGTYVCREWCELA